MRIEVALDEDTASYLARDLKPGTTALAEVYCGRSSLGYVWLHEAFEAAQRFWFQWF